MESETTKVATEEMSFDIGVTVQATYGPVSISATSNFATSKSSAQSDASAIRYGKDVTARALQRIIERTSEQRIHKALEEFEDSNKHVTDNIGGTGHIVGLYRWVDKIYEAKIVNYGKRLMFEFLVPEPAAYHIYAMKQSNAMGFTAVKPLHPVADISSIQKVFPWLLPLQSHWDLTNSNYAFWAGMYGAKVDPPPGGQIIGIAKSQANNQFNPNENIPTFAYNDLVVPDGYEAVNGFVQEIRSNGPTGTSWCCIIVGGSAHYSPHNGGHFSNITLTNETGTIPMAAITTAYSIAWNTEVYCRPTFDTYETWRIKTFNAIMESYEAKLAAYNNALAEFLANSGVNIRGNNPAFNRQTEQAELQKHCLRLLTSCTFATSNAWQEDYWTAPNQPDFHCCTAISEGLFVQFVENCFDWQLMTYTFYPYFFARRAKWSELHQIDDTDPIFREFLKAGYARVVVPVREGFEDAAMRFAADGTIWNGGPVPGINDPYYLSIVDEMKKPVGEVEGDPWQIRVPTSLTILQNDASGIEGSGLPCDPNGI
jgi:hypothetical protein